MTIADLIEQALRSAGGYRDDDDLPDAVLAERRRIRERYGELKRTMDFTSAAAQARREAVERILGESQGS